MKDSRVTFHPTDAPFANSYLLLPKTDEPVTFHITTLNIYHQNRNRYYQNETTVAFSFSSKGTPTTANPAVGKSPFTYPFLL
jgi:hypothetical protein